MEEATHLVRLPGRAGLISTAGKHRVIILAVSPSGYGVTDL